jgi:serine/threonine protein kinase
VRYLDTRAASSEKIREFEHKFLAEVRMLGALRNHSSIVDIYGHQLSCKWVPDSDGSGKEYRLLQTAIAMEYVRGGSLKVLNVFVLFDCHESFFPITTCVADCSLLQLRIEIVLVEDYRGVTAQLR